jgi:hypothetical protein
MARANITQRCNDERSIIHDFDESRWIAARRAVERRRPAVANTKNGDAAISAR